MTTISSKAELMLSENEGYVHTKPNRVFSQFRKGARAEK